MILKDGDLKRIHVDQMAIRKSQREKLDLPSILVILVLPEGDQLYSGRKVLIQGWSWIAQSFAKELPTGASVWIETWAEVHIDEE